MGDVAETLVLANSQASPQTRYSGVSGQICSFACVALMMLTLVSAADEDWTFRAYFFSFLATNTALMQIDKTQITDILF